MWYASWCGRLFIFQTIIYMVVRYVFFVILLHYACTESKTANRVSCNIREWFWQGGREAIKIFVILSRGSHTAHNCHHIVDHVSLHLFPDISSQDNYCKVRYTCKWFWPRGGGGEGQWLLPCQALCKGFFLSARADKCRSCHCGRDVDVWCGS